MPQIDQPSTGHAEPMRRLTFRDLLAPLTPEDFLDGYFDRKPLHLPGSAGRFKDLFSWDQVAALLAMAALWTESTLRISVDGQDLDAEAYCAPQRDRSGVAMHPDPERVQDLIRRGAAIALRSIETMAPGVAAVAIALQCRFDGETACDAHCAWHGHRKSKVSFETRDQFVLQIDGTTTWTIYESRIEQAADVDGFQANDMGEAHAGRARGTVHLEAPLTPGDVLYVPRGQLHSLRTADEATMHLTFSLERVRGYQFAGAIADALQQDPFFRRPLPRFDKPEAHRAHLQVLADRLHAYMLTPGPARSIRQEQRLRAFSRCRPAYALPSAVPPQVFRVRSLRTRLVRDDAGWRLEQANSGTALSDGEAALAEWLLPQDFFTADEAAAAHGGGLPVTAALERFKTISLIDEI